MIQFTPKELLYFVREVMRAERTVLLEQADRGPNDREITQEEFNSTVMQRALLNVMFSSLGV